jgi:hypothetical protein
MTNQFINELRSSSNLADRQLVKRYNQLQALASVEACLNDEGLEMLANLRGVVIPALHKLRGNRRWLQMNTMARAQALQTWVHESWPSWRAA